MVTSQLTIMHERIIIDGMEYVSVDEAAEITGYASAYIRRLLREGKIRAAKKGSMWWIELDSLEEYKRQMDLLGREKFSPWRDRE
jgi:excisionase family DNA binding protein